MYQCQGDALCALGLAAKGSLGRGGFSGQEGLVSDGRVGFLWNFLAPDGLYKPGLK